MKQFKKLALCLLAAVMALTALTACGRTPLDVQYDTEKQAVAEAALSEYLTRENLSMEKDATMMEDAKQGLEPAVAYLTGVLSKRDSAVEILWKVSMSTSELQDCYDEHRFIRIQLKEEQFSQEAVLNNLSKEMKKVAAKTPPTKYGLCVCTYDGWVYVAMFMA